MVPPENRKFAITRTNTGAVTLTAHGRTFNIVRADGSPLQAGDLPAGAPLRLGPEPVGDDWPLADGRNRRARRAAASQRRRER